MIPSTVVKKIPKSDHHERRRIKNKFPVLFVANVINSATYLLHLWLLRIPKTTKSLVVYGSPDGCGDHPPSQGRMHYADQLC